MKYTFFLLTCCWLIVSCEKGTPAINKSSTQMMVDTLRYIIDNTDPLKNYYVNDLRAAHFKNKMETASPREKGVLYYSLFKELINGGKNQEAIKEIQQFVQLIGLDINNIDKNSRLIFELLALAHLRDGEVNNCIQNHNAQSCIMPLGDMALHQDKNGSQKAIEIYQKILDKFPEDLSSRWLLNVAYMTLGKYPNEIPAAYLIPGLDEKKKTDLIAFSNIATGMGIDVNRISGGVCIDDFNNDGFLDIFSSSYAMEDELQVFFSDKNGGYIDVSKEAGLKGIKGGLNLLQADYNNDGFLDVLVLRGAWFGEAGNQPNSLLKNNGDGTFEDVTFSCGLLSFHPTQAATWADFNNDGWIDLFIANETEASTIKNPCELYINNNGQFTNVAEQSGVNAMGFFKGVCSGDINNDGWMDIYLSNLDGLNILYQHTGEAKHIPSFQNITASANVSKPYSSFPTWFWDYDNDGWQDLFVSTYDYKGLQKVGHIETLQQLGLAKDQSKPQLYKNNGDNTFTNSTEGTELDRVMFPMGANFGDLDNDGFLDMYLGTGAPDLKSIVPNLTFKNNQGKFFEDITYASGMAHIQKGHGVAFGDLDNDGDQDIYTVMGGAYSGDNFHNALFENSNHKHNWITLKLEGTKTNRAAIGSRIKIDAEKPNGETATFYHTVSTGGSFGASSLQQEIGLGSANKINQITIVWANQDQDKVIFQNPEINSFYKIKEGQPNLEKVQIEKIAFKQNHEGHHHHH